MGRLVSFYPLARARGALARRGSSVLRTAAIGTEVGELLVMMPTPRICRDQAPDLPMPYGDCFSRESGNDMVV